MILPDAPAHADRASLAERVARGKAARRTTPRRLLGTFDVTGARPGAVETLEEQARTRVQQLVPIRYGRMLVSPFAFFRGAAAIMAGDLARLPSTGLTAQCCGDAHVSNFGAFASPDRRLVFDLNDFDETLPAPFEWDVKRLAASIAIAAEDNGLRTRDGDASVLAGVRAYREAMARFARTPTLDVWYTRLDVDDLVAANASRFARKSARSTRRTIERARTRDSWSALSKLTALVDGEPRIVDQWPLIVPLDRLAAGRDRDQLLERLSGLLLAYRASLPEERRVLLDQFRLVDFAHKVVGVGSVGTRAWIALLLGHDDREPLFLQIKEANASVLEPALGPSAHPHHGQRVVVGQRLMQAASDVFLGWLSVDEDDGSQDYYCRQLRDWKASIAIDHLDPAGLVSYAQLCGWTLARAHARTGDRAAIDAYIGASDRFDRALLAFARDYAEQNARDYAALQAAVDAGEVAVEHGL